MMPKFDTDFFLGELPEGNFQQFVQQRQPRQRQRHFSTMFADIQREYNKALVGFAAQNRGQSPTTQKGLDTFSNFMDQFDWDEKFYEAPPWERDSNYAAFNPRTMFRYDR